MVNSGAMWVRYKQSVNDECTISDVNVLDYNYIIVNDMVV